MLLWDAIQVLDSCRLALSGRVYCRSDFVEGATVDTSAVERVHGRVANVGMKTFA